MPQVHELKARVYYEDTDAGGVVYHANFLKFAERGRTEYLRARGFEHHDLMEKAGILFVVRAMDIDYQAPGKLDDILRIETSVSELKGASFRMRQDIFRDHDNVLLAGMNVTIVCIDAAFKAVRLPDELRAAFV